MDMDIVSVYHRDDTYEDWLHLCEEIQQAEPDAAYNLVGVDNRKKNMGFARGCNWGATRGEAPIVGFINPDASVSGPFIHRVQKMLEKPDVVITGCRFEKPDYELRIWGCVDWVCGAAFFVRRDFWEEVNGFDEQFVWGWEETDMIRQAQALGSKVVSIDLPISHQSPDQNSDEDVLYKHKWFAEGAKRFQRKWSTKGLV